MLMIYSLIQDGCKDDFFFCVQAHLQDIFRFVITWLLWTKYSRYMACMCNAYNDHEIGYCNCVDMMFIL